MDRSPEMVVALLAALKAGGAYLPLDFSHPKERLAFILQDSRPSALLTRRGLAENLPPLITLLQGATVEQQARLLRGHDNGAHTSSLVALKPEGSRRPVFCVHPAGGNVLGFADLSAHLEKEQPFYALQSRGLCGEEEPHTHVAEMAAHYLDEIRKVQPEGPYIIGGWSMGGVVAFEMAQQLHARRQQVERLILLDSRLFNAGGHAAEEDAVLLRPLPFRDPERVVLVWMKGAEAAGGDRVPLSVADFLDWRTRARGFERVAFFSPDEFNYTNSETPERVRGAVASADFFAVLGEQPELGRTFLPDEERLGAARVVVVSHSFWQRRLGSDPHAAGREITLDGRPYTVVGVMPERFGFPREETELWAAYQIEPPSRRGPYWLQGLARRREGVTLEQARAEMNSIPDPDRPNEPPRGERFTVLPVNDYLVGDVRPALLILLGAVALVLLIAAANVANLMLARAASREREMSIRMALGAGRGRILRQLLTENLLLAAVGGGLGLLLAYWGVKLLLSLNPGLIHRLQEATLDGRVLLWAVGLTLLSGLFFGVLPTLQASRSGLSVALKGGGRGTSESRDRRRLRGALVVAEMALALMLLVCAGLLVRSFLSLRQVDSGVNPARVVTMQVSLPPGKYRETAQRKNLYQQMLERVKGVPGVEAAALTLSLPPDMQSVSDNFSIEGQPPRHDSELPVGDLILVTPDYFRTLGIPVLRGHTFSESDREESPRVCVINETLAREAFQGENPVGRHLKQGGVERPDNRWMEIVGVVGDVKYGGLHAKVQPVYYIPFAQAPWGDVSLVVRSVVADPAALVPAIRREVWSLDRDLPIARVRTMDDLLSGSVAQPRFRTLLLSVFSAMALLLASVGIYGVMSYTVVRRTKEIGVRMVLGAQRGHVLRLVVGQGMRLVLIGILLGLAGAFALARVMSGLLYGVTATDPLTFAGVPLLLSAVALVACLVPALRATKVDPQVALRYE